MKLTIDGKTYAVEPGNDSVSVDGTSYKIKREGNGSLMTIQVNGRPYKVDLSGGNGTAIVDGRSYQASLEGKAGAKRPGAGAIPKPKTAGGIKALMPGRIIAVRVKPGDAVAAGDVLLILEAMKMENEIRTPAAGTVKSVPVSPGSNVDKGDTLAVVE